MISISSKCRYGLTALLALTESYDVGLMQLKDISAGRNIPHQYLEQIFNRLSKAGIVSSVRGKNGGYRLARAPSKITVLDIINVLEGGIELVSAPEDSSDAIQELFHKAEAKLEGLFKVSLADLATRQQSLHQHITYHI